MDMMHILSKKTSLFSFFIIIAGLVIPITKAAYKEEPKKTSQYIISQCFASQYLLRGESENLSRIFLEGNQAYEQGRFEEAARLYEATLDLNISSGMIYYNLGNSYTKLGEIGRAILNYRRAQRLMPRDGDLKFNLKYALDQRKDKIETKENVKLIKVFFFWYYWLNLKELFYFFLIINLIFWTTSLILIYKQNGPLKWIRILSLCLFLIFGATFAAKAYAQKRIQTGVVITQEATVRSGNGTNHSPLFILHEGAEFTITQKAKDWLKIYLADGKIGWISFHTVEII